MKKRILLICKESYAWPVHYVAKILRKEGHTVAAFFPSPPESMRNDADWAIFNQLNADIPVYSGKWVGEEYIRRVKAKDLGLDWKYLNEIERKYSHFKTLGLQQLASQFLSTYAHFRTYYHDVPTENQLLFMQLHYQNAERILDEFRPDAIYDADYADVSRALLFEIAYARGIPYVTIEPTRFNDYYFPSPTQTLKDEDWISNLLEKKIADLNANSDRSTRPGAKALAEFRASRKILIPTYHNWFKGSRFRPFWEFYNIISGTLRYVPQQIKEWWWYYRHATSPIFSDPVASTILKFKVYYRRLRSVYFTPFERPDLSKENYILFPLHMIPESSTFTKSPFFLNEEFLIECLSKSVPPGQKIFVKEHWFMVGERPMSFYKKIKRLPNVVLIDPNMHSDPRPYLDYAQGVVTITGSSAFEGILLGKPALVFGPTHFNMLKSVHHTTDVTQIPTIIRTWKNRLSSDLELEAYLELAMEFGEKMYIHTLTTREIYQDPAKAMPEAERLYRLFRRGEQLAKDWLFAGAKGASSAREFTHAES